MQLNAIPKPFMFDMRLVLDKQLIAHNFEEDRGMHELW